LEKVIRECQKIHEAGNFLIIAGDLNTAHREIDLKNPAQNRNNSGFLAEERNMIDRFIGNGLVDIFRFRNPEKQQYTWWTYRYGARKRNIGWRLDYFLISAGLVEKVNSVVIRDDIFGSDHCPVILDIHF
jgi:exodeoxyribonuclease-3